MRFHLLTVLILCGALHCSTVDGGLAKLFNSVLDTVVKSSILRYFSPVVPPAIAVVRAGVAGIDGYQNNGCMGAWCAIGSSLVTSTNQMTSDHAAWGFLKIAGYLATDMINGNKNVISALRDRTGHAMTNPLLLERVKEAIMGLHDDITANESRLIMVQHFGINVLRSIASVDPVLESFLNLLSKAVDESQRKYHKKKLLKALEDIKRGVSLPELLKKHGKEVIMEVAGNDPNILSAIAIIETAERIVNGDRKAYVRLLSELKNEELAKNVFKAAVDILKGEIFPSLITKYGKEAVYILAGNDPRLVSALDFIDRKKDQPKRKSPTENIAKPKLQPSKRAAISLTTQQTAPVEHDLFGLVQ